VIFFRAGAVQGKAGTGTQVVEDEQMCFVPKAIIFRVTSLFGGGGSGQFHSLGFTDENLAQFSVGTRWDTGVNPNGFWAFTYPNTTRAIALGVSGATVTDMSTENQFTLNWATDGDDYLVQYWAFGGDDLLNKAKIINPTTGSQSFTGYGFQGQLLMWLGARGSTWNTEDSSRMTMDFGFASGSASSEQFACFGDAHAGANPSSVGCQFNDDRVDNWGNTDFTSWGADGYTVNTVGNYGGVNFATLVLGDASEQSFKVSNGTQKTSTGTQAYTGAGFAPGAVAAAGMNDTDLTGASRDNAYFTFGAFDSLQHDNVWVGTKSNVNPTQALGRHSTSKLIVHGNPSAVVAEAEVNTLDSDGVTLDSTTADATARYFGLIYMKTVPGSPCPTPALASYDGVFVI